MNTNQQKDSAFLLICVFAFGISCYGAWLFFTAYQSANWPTTQGEIVNSERKADGTPFTRYSYIVKDKKYSSDLIKVGITNQQDNNTTYRILTSYQVGTKVTVFYDPNNPSTGYIEVGDTGLGTAFILLGGLTTLLAWLRFKVRFSF